LRQYTNKEKKELLDCVMWDSPVLPSDLLAILQGKKEQVLHVTRKLLIKRLIESYSWFTVIAILPVQDLIPLLDAEFIRTLRFPSLQRRYAFIRKRFQKYL
jgi:hypothetical protein